MRPLSVAGWSLSLSWHALMAPSRSQLRMCQCTRAFATTTCSLQSFPQIVNFAIGFVDLPEENLAYVEYVSLKNNVAPCKSSLTLKGCRGCVIDGWWGIRYLATDDQNAKI